MTAPIEVKGPVFVTVSPVVLRLYAYDVSNHAFDPDGGWERPWKWWAMVRLKFTIGELTTTKKVVQSYAWLTPLGYPRCVQPSDAELAEGRETVLENLRRQVARHGFEPPEFRVHETRMGPVR